MPDYFQIQAEFPLGVYYGGNPSGEREILPDMARVFSALVHSAYRQSEAQNGELTGIYTEAFGWLEENPPSALAIPDHTLTQSASTAPIAYNSEGFCEKNTIKVAGKPAGVGTAIAGPICWLWEGEQPSAAIVEALDDLCSEVAYLGESTSVVQLSCSVVPGDSVVPTHQLGDVPFLPASHGAVSCAVPRAGRLDELDRSYSLVLEAKKPTKAADKPAKNESLRLDVVARHAVEPLWYEQVDSVSHGAHGAPWAAGLFWPAAPTSHRIRPVQACSILHKALCMQLDGFNLPSVTGRYLDGVLQPANRVALHYLDDHAARLAGLPGHGFLLATPTGMEVDERELVFEAARRIHFVRAGGRVDLQRPVRVDLTEFWPEPASGTRRLWSSADGVVPESRARQRGASTLLTLEDAACLSISYVYRDVLQADSNLGRPGRISAVRDIDVEVFRTTPILPFKAQDYVHKVPKTLGIHPFELDVCLADLHANQAFLALGQSRHLGGGLMVPLDISRETLNFWRTRRVNRT